MGGLTGFTLVYASHDTASILTALQTLNTNIMERFIIEPKKIQKSVKEIYKNIDLYGAIVLVTMLQQYSHISFCDNSVPTPGSPIKQMAALRNPELITSISKVIYHKDGKTTIKTNVGFLQFLNI